MEYIIIIISAIFVNNIVLSKFLGICPFMGVSNKVSTAAGIIVSTEVEQSKNDALSKVAEVLAVGELNDYGEKFAPAPKVGTKIIIDNFVGDKINDNDISPEFEYRVIYIFDVLGWIK